MAQKKIKFVKKSFKNDWSDFNNRQGGSCKSFMVTCFALPNVAKMLKNPEIKYFMLGEKEVCPTSGRDHWHLYIRLHKSYRFPGLAKLIGLVLGSKEAGGNMWAIEPRNLEEDGDPSSWDEGKMISYVSKEGVHTEHGERKYVRGNKEKGVKKGGYAILNRETGMWTDEEVDRKFICENFTDDDFPCDFSNGMY